MTARCPIVACQTVGCHWRGRMPDGKKPRCPSCQRVFRCFEDIE